MEAVYRKVYDFSVHNGRIDWDRLKESGVDFVMLRAGYGKNNIDERFYDNASACIRLGIPFGIYWFSYAYTVDMAEREAGYALDAVKKYKLECPVAYDLEYDTVRYAATKGVVIRKELATAMAAAFCGRVGRAGYMAVNYSNRDYLDRMFSDCLLSYPLWYARYNKTAGREDMALWQYSSEGKVPGVDGKVDMNYAFRELPSESAGQAGMEGSIGTGEGVTEYSLKRDGSLFFRMDGRKTDFRVREFRCKDGSDAVKVDAGLVRILQKIRDYFGKPVVVNSAYRTETYNAKVNGAAGSRHLYGMAADIRIEGVTPLTAAAYAESIGVKGIGMYGSFVHVDTRDEKYFWADRSGNSVSTFGGSPGTGKVPGTGTVLKQGSRGEDVAWLQERLNAKINAGLDVDGIYGGQTGEAVRCFQRSAGIKDDGIAGPVTVGYLAA